jgi:hypothetical protein
VNAQQLEIEVLYSLQFESAASMFDLRDVVTYLAQRVGRIHGRVWFGDGNAVNVTLTAKQRRNFQRFLNRHGLKRLSWAVEMTGINCGNSYFVEVWWSIICTETEGQRLELARAHSWAGSD